MILPEVRARRACPEDAPEVSFLLKAAQDYQRHAGLPLAWRLIPEAAVRGSIERGETYLFSLEGSATLATAALEWADPDVWPGLAPAGYLHRLAVHPDAHCQGVGSALLVWAAGEVSDRGLSSLRLDAVAANTSLCTWYQARGFSPRGEVLLPSWTRASLRLEQTIT